MEDNPEVNMDTDVSSTTADVPETQEVTGSDGQVEMVIVVEKVDEEVNTDDEVESFTVSSPEDVGANCEAEKSTVSVEATTISSLIDQSQDIYEKPDDSVKTKDVTITENINENRDSKELHTDSTDKAQVLHASVNSIETIQEYPNTPKSPVKQSNGDDDDGVQTIIEISEESNKIEDKKENVTTGNINICEKSNDSHMECIPDVPEKDLNKSISRELKSLIKSAKDSKIISECTQLTTKTRKSRIGLDSSTASPSCDADKIRGRRNSNNSQLSNSSEQSEKVPIKRSMRSQNPEFVNKVKQFLNSVTGKNNKGDTDDEGIEEIKRDRNESLTLSIKKKRVVDKQEELFNKETKLQRDPYCWRCHWHVEQTANEKIHLPMHCSACWRTYHYKCLTSAEKTKIDTEKTWVCPECLVILHAESSETRSPSMKKISLGLLHELLQHALERMLEVNGVEPFLSPVDDAEFPDYNRYVVNPMDLSVIKKNVADGLYGSTEAFAADVQWILHNSIIFNTLQSKLTTVARVLVRTCRAQMGEIEACPECYAAAHARRPTWFVDVCTTPHILLWAKLKGFPYWPAKGMSVNGSGLVDVRFFGAHDRAWVPARDCYLYSEKDPNNFRTKRQDIIDSMQEAEHHIRNISRKYGKFVYPPFKTPFEPTKHDEQIKAMIPSFDGDLKSYMVEKTSGNSPTVSKNKDTSNFKRSKSNERNVSETEEAHPATERTSTDGAETAQPNDYGVEKGNGTVETVAAKTEGCRSSHLEEAVFTIMDGSSSSSSKKRRHERGSKESDDHSSKKRKTDNDDKSNVKKVETSSTTNREFKESPSSTVRNVTSVIVTPESSHKSKSHRSSTSSASGKEAVQTSKPKHMSIEKTGPIEKLHESKSRGEKRRHSKNRSSTGSNSEKVHKSVDKRDKAEGSTSVKEKLYDHKIKESEKTNDDSSKKGDSEKQGGSRPSRRTPQVINSVVVTKLPPSGSKNFAPTISCIRSLSKASQPSYASKESPSGNTVEITIDCPKVEPKVSALSKPVDVRKVRDAVTVKKLKAVTERQSLVGKVGVKAFARIKSPEQQKQSVEVEIKAEPIDLDDADRQIEKLDLMNMFRLRPVNPPQNLQPQTLRDVRINKVVVTPVIRNAAPKPQESRKARKSFPQSKKPDEGRSELNGKNSMVYIPIQPPSSQAPVRPVRPITINATSQCLRSTIPPPTSAVNTTVNTVRPPVVSMVVTSSPASASPTAPSSLAVATKTTNMPLVQSVGQMPPTVQTVPLITTVNGQCFFSLQPLMSMGGVEAQPQQVINEISERVAVLPGVMGPPAPAPAGLAPLNGTVVDAIGELPRLQQRPTYLSAMDPCVAGALPQATHAPLPPAPADSGPLSDKLYKNAAKLTELFRSMLEDTLEKVDDPSAQLMTAKLQLEQVQWKHQQEIQELKHNHDLMLTEMRSSMEKETVRAVNEALRTARVEAEAAVKATKAKQWCANCSQEAKFYCCWNTAYCDYPCQRAHWKKHFSTCTQERSQDGSNSSDSNRRLTAPDRIPRSTTAPALTVGGKVATMRTCTKPNPETVVKPGKSSMLVNVVEEKSGSPTVKCLGAYKPISPQVSPLLVNNQVLTNEEGSKKVVTSGGYLIVGTGNGAPLVTPRRTHAVQYFS